MRQGLQRIGINVLLTIAVVLSLQAVPAQRTTTPQAGPETVSLISALEPFYHISSLPAYGDQTVVRQVSSYDTTGGNDDGFSGKYSYLKKLSDTSLLLFDVEGPGVINRIWTPTPSDDSLDFYIDDLTQAAFTIKYRDLFSGKVFPFVKPLCNNQLGGYFCYLPIPFQRHCRIVYRGKQTQFHQIGYRLYPAKTVVKSFRPELAAAEKDALQRVQTLWDKRGRTVQDFWPGTAAAFQTAKTQFQLSPGEKHTLLQTAKGGRIIGFELDPSSAFEGSEKEIDLKITWDHETAPAVYCPVADFFGYAFGKTSMQSLLIGSNGKKNYCYFPMPFDRSATIELIYRKPSSAKAVSSPLTIRATVYSSNEARKTSEEGKFYAYWNNQPHVPLHQPHLFLHVAGKGHYVGTVLQAQGLEPGMTLFFEGDDSTVVDGQLRMHGTGSEDYFNGGWYALMDRWDGPFSMPLSGALDYSLPLSRTGGYRLHLADKIPFEKEIYHSIEHGPEHNNKPAFYTSVAYYYSNTPPLKTVPVRTEETGVLTPDTMMLYPQLLTFNSNGDIAIQQRGESFVFNTANESSIRVQLQEIPYGNYRILLDYSTLPQGGLFSLWQRQTGLTDWIRTYSPAPEQVKKKYFCDISLTPLNHTLTIRFKAEGEKKQFSLHRIVLVKAKE
ncbi:MAG: DUF2961 domain-containing protein [Williamsia sp.]|nr:DUF2961 domain-containing protein [Williamsia sp.]